MRPKIFIASATKDLAAARAFQAALESHAEVTIWDQGVFAPSTYTLPVLIERASVADFGIMVVGPDAPPNENVLIELGLFIGRLALDRVYLALPRRASPIELPSDLDGLTRAYYDGDRADGNIEAAVATAAHSIMRRISQIAPEVAAARKRLAEVRYFEEFAVEFPRLCATSSRIDACFIHSRRWREQYGLLLKNSIEEGTLKQFTLFLPDVRRADLVADLRATFDDGPAIPGMIYDALQWASGLVKLRAGIVKVFLYPHVPGHTFYRFDDSAVLALYPAAVARKSVPAILCHEGSQTWEFLGSDIRDLQVDCSKAGVRTLDALAGKFKATGAFG